MDQEELFNDGFEDEGDELSDGVKELMEDYDLDRETAEKVQEIMDEHGLDAEEAIELVDSL